MRLSEIRLSGFKSFAEPVNLTFPHRLTGVVGPNGCGKSNIVDALIWVMGESSARHLRGETLADVIFNGAGGRARAGRAQVELRFDNSAGRIGGRLASYSEISIRRTLDRDGVSAYYLNATPCRRKDIQALLRGTGLGPRSYAVVEQGMISRLVEARPEELRAHIEEAAGVSRYRAARRETTNRMHHTRENLARLLDVRQEVQDHIRTLERQSRQAERYHRLTEQRARLEAEALALEWRELERLCVREQQTHTQRVQSLEADRIRLAGLTDELRCERAELDALGQDCEGLKRECYKQDADIGRLEQSIQHARERAGNLARELTRGQEDVARELKQLSEERRNAEELGSRHAVLQAKVVELEAAGKQAQDQLSRSEQAMRGWHEEWEQCTTARTGSERRRELLDARAGHLHERLRELERQHGERQEELQAIDPGTASRELEQRQSELQQAEQRRLELEGDEQQSQARLAELNASIVELQRDLDSGRLVHQELHASLTSLTTLQEVELGREVGTEMLTWLRERGWDEQPRMGEQIRIAPRWRRAVELVLGVQLKAVQVDDLDSAARSLEGLPGGEFGAYSATAAADTVAMNGTLPALHEMAGVQGLPAELLAGIYAAPDVETALAAHRQLRPGEYIATPEGMLLGRDWIRAVGSGERSGILQRSGELESLRARHVESGQRCRAREQELGELRAEAEQQQAVCEALRHRLREQHEQWSDRRSNLAVGMEQLEQRQARAARLKGELEIIATEKHATTEALKRTETDRERLISTQRDIDATRGRLEQSRQQLETALATARVSGQQADAEQHRLALALESVRSRRASLLESVQRREHTAQQLQERCRELAQERTSLGHPLPELQTQLDAARQGRKHVDEKLTIMLERRQARHDAWSGRDREHTDGAAALQAKEQELHQLELDVREREVRRDAVAEQLAALEVVVEVAALEEDASAQQCREQLKTLQASIDRIGPVNLGATAEQEELHTRHGYLDEQCTDLEQSLTTLERAIRRIDRESRRRFMATLEQVDANLGELFSTLFGGGSAHLVMEADNPLEGGLRFMAQLPGKRNTSLQLLSGGEKALAALALVFAIFRLNPAPLCVLDEVDASLDDANIARYCELVRRMAGQVQFIIVSHNKSSMEMVDTLLGVTMQEAGVSRLVGVNVEEAVELAASA